MLRHYLRYVVEHPDEAQSKANAAAAFIRSHFSWDKAADAVVRRLQQLHALPIRRLSTSETQPVIVPKSISESWERPDGSELASIIVLCCNQLDYTRQCLESVLQHTRPPYELLLIDNASTDATPDYLDELRRRPGPERVEVIRNDKNLGFAAGCNQGLAAALGEYLVLLNNDTIVTQDWLSGLIKWSLHELAARRSRWTGDKLIPNVAANSSFVQDARGIAAIRLGTPTGPCWTRRKSRTPMRLLSLDAA